MLRIFNLMASLFRSLRCLALTIFLFVIVMVLPGCVGNGGGSLEMPEPNLSKILGEITEWRSNPSAEDLHDHWNDTEVLRQGVGMGLVGLSGSDATDRLGALSSILQTSKYPLDQSGTLLRNVDIGAMTVIGERDGITYGQWKSGPAGTLDIDFDYRFAPEFDVAARARMERAGKSWSWRLGDDFGTNTVTARRIARSRTQDGVTAEEMVMTQDFITDDMLIFVQQHDGTPRSQGGYSHRSQSALNRNDYQAYAGFVRIGEHRFTDVPARGDIRLTSIMAHEIGHVLGIARGLADTQYFQNLVDEQASTFNGPHAVAVHGGPVPFQWLGSNRNTVPPNTPGARLDSGHLGPCTSVMSYCRNEYNLYAPSELDFAFLADIGYEVLKIGTEEEPEVYGFGAWGRYSAWGAGVERTISYTEQTPGGFDNANLHNLHAEDSLRAGADAFGIAPTASLSNEHGPQGSVTWSGSLIGVDLHSPHLPPVFGDAEVTIDLATLEGSADFNNLTVVNNGATSTFRAPNLDYAIEVTGNSFSDSGGRIAGGFFGPAHEEMAGVLRDEAPNVNLLGGFGGAR